MVIALEHVALVGKLKKPPFILATLCLMVEKVKVKDISP